MNRDLKISSNPKKIISLVPSITELLHDLGLQNEVVGVTKFCIHPKEWCTTKAKIGGTKKVKMDIVADLQPDLIIGNKEENTKEDISELEKRYKVLMTDVNSFEEALDMIELIGSVCNKEKESRLLTNQLRSIHKDHKSHDFKSAIYLIWKDPYYAVGQQTFINDMLTISGFKNLVLEPRYPETSIEIINDMSPEYLLLSTEPYPFANKHIRELIPYLTNIKPILVDGEMFSWYGSRLLKSFAYFEQLKLELDKN